MHVANVLMGGRLIRRGGEVRRGEGRGGLYQSCIPEYWLISLYWSVRRTGLPYSNIINGYFRFKSPPNWLKIAWFNYAFECDLSPFVPPVPHKEWGDLPLPSLQVAPPLDGRNKFAWYGCCEFAMTNHCQSRHQGGEQTWQVRYTDWYKVKSHTRNSQAGLSWMGGCWHLLVDLGDTASIFYSGPNVLIALNFAIAILSSKL